jgi:hypothetical protein
VIIKPLSTYRITQADCPPVTDIVTTAIRPKGHTMSSQFRVEEFPASSEICAPVNTTNVKSGTNSISSTVHPVPAPFSTNALASSRIREGGSSQNEILFNRGKAISGAPSCTGTI